MAPLRSSRSNRHLQQDTPQGRTRGGVVDHDPTEGLPVRRWEMTEVTINQEPKEEGKDEDGRNGNNDNWPWPDLLPPRDIHLLAAHSQELLRRARAPNKNPNIAVFNSELGEYERPGLDPHNPSAMTLCSKLPSFREGANVNAKPRSPHKDSDNDPSHGDSDQEVEKPNQELQDRTITLKRWISLPSAVADKKPDPKYLADRRPGLPPLYGHHAVTLSSGAGQDATLKNPADPTAQNLTSVGTPTAQILADGSSLPTGPGFALDGTPLPVSLSQSHLSGQVQGQSPAQNKRRPPPPPPKRKKKGGPGRSRKKVEIADASTGGGQAPTGVIDPQGGAGVESGQPLTGSVPGAEAERAKDSMAPAQAYSGASTTNPGVESVPVSGLTDTSTLEASGSNFAPTSAAAPASKHLYNLQPPTNTVTSSNSLDPDTAMADAELGNEGDDGSEETDTSNDEDEDMGSEEGEIGEGHDIANPGPAPAEVPTISFAPAPATSSTLEYTTVPELITAPEPVTEPVLIDAGISSGQSAPLTSLTSPDDQVSAPSAPVLTSATITNPTILPPVEVPQDPTPPIATFSTVTTATISPALEAPPPLPAVEEVTPGPAAAPTPATEVSPIIIETAPSTEIAMTEPQIPKPELAPVSEKLPEAESYPNPEAEAPVKTPPPTTFALPDILDRLEAAVDAVAEEGKEMDIVKGNFEEGAVAEKLGGIEKDGEILRDGVKAVQSGEGEEKKGEEKTVVDKGKEKEADDTVSVMRENIN